MNGSIKYGGVDSWIQAGALEKNNEPGFSRPITRHLR
jgi:hypothetical protein